MSITHKWNGTVLTITSDSGTSSADLKGEKGDTGIRGAQGRTGFTIGADGIIDTSGLATEQYVVEAINNADKEHLSGYATENYVDTLVADFEANNGLTTTEKNLLIDILRNSIYTTKQKENIDLLEAALAYSPASLHYKVTNSLVYVLTNNNSISVAQGYVYNATLTAYNGMEIKSVVVKMGGIDITNECYKDGLIKIEAVTGNIEITAIAKGNLYLELVQGQIVNSKPYYSSNTRRVSYVGLECLVTPNKTYRLVGVDGVNYGVQTITNSGYEKVKQNLAITNDVDKFDSGWQNNGYTFTTRENAVCVWICARKPNESDIVPNDAMPVYIEEVI